MNPDQATVDAIETRARQWLACQLAGDLFRVWALESNAKIRDSIFAAYGPQFAPETLRNDLERLAEGATDTPFQAMTVAPDAYVPMIVTSGFDTYHPESQHGLVWIPLYWTTLDGSVAAIPYYLTREQYEDPAYKVLRDANLPNQAV